MMIILALDGLEYEYVKEFNCRHLMQTSYGKTDISMFSEPRTVVIWSSFLTGRNTEKEALKDLWNFRVRSEETFFSFFEKWHAIDVPGFTYLRERHAKERELLKAFFEGSASVEEYDAVALENHEFVKERFLEAVEGDYDMVMGYFALADVIGHLSFGIKPKMRAVYGELDEIAKLAGKKASKMLIISDHGMRAIGRFGDHSNYGFWSFSERVEWKTPKITEFKNLIGFYK